MKPQKPQKSNLVKAESTLIKKNNKSSDLNFNQKKVVKIRQSLLKKRSKVLKKINKLQLKKNNYVPFGFPNILMNRTLLAKPRLVWQFDGYFLDTELNKNLGSKHYLMSAVDPATNKLIFSKSFFSKDGHKTCTSKQIIKIIKKAQKEEGIEASKEKIIIHTDKGSHFTSKEFVDFINQHPLLEGSHAPAGTPTSNAVVERMHRSFKYQYKNFNCEFPKKVKQSRDLQIIIDRKRYAMNHEARPLKNFKRSPNEMERNLLDTEVSSGL